MSDEPVTTMAANGALPVSIQDRDRFVSKTNPGRSYTLAVLSDRERRRMRRQIIADHGTYPNEGEVRDAVREAALVHFDPEQAAAVSLAIEELSQLEQNGDTKDPEVVAVLDDLEKRVNRYADQLSRKDRVLSTLIATRWTWIDMVSYYTVRACIRDWEGVTDDAGEALPCVRRDGLVLEEQMAAIEPDLDDLVVACAPKGEVTRDQE